MIYHSRFYMLEDGADQINLRRRTDGSIVYQSAFWQAAGRLGLVEDLPDLPQEAQRLILQWALEIQGAQILNLSNLSPSAPIKDWPTLNAQALAATNPEPPKGLDGWAQMGARFDGQVWSVSAVDFGEANRALGCRGAAWLERCQPLVQVAALALINPENQVLLAQRPADKSFAGLWEFPGGKIEPGESPELALCREAAEELGLELWNSCLSPLTFASHAYADFHLMLLAFVAYRFDGTPKGQEGQILKWWNVQDLDADQMPPANAAVIHALQDLI